MRQIKSRQHGERRIGRRDVVRKPGLHQGKKANDHKREDRPNAQLTSAHRGSKGKWIQENERWCGDQKHPKVVPAMRDMPFDGGTRARQYVKPDILSQKFLAKVHRHVQMPGENQKQKNQKSPTAVFAKTAEVPAFEQG